MPDTDSPASVSRPWWVWVNVLGLDAVLTALLWMKLFSCLTNAHLITAEYVVLGCAVWCVYTLDRMLDGLMAGGLRGERHRFASRRWLLLSAGIAAASAVGAWLLAWHVREIVSVWGFKLLAAVGIYFGITWFSRQAWTGLVGACTLGGLLAMGLMQGAMAGAADVPLGILWPQLWRGAMAGFLVTVLYLSVRQPGLPAPWVLPRKLLGGWLFAVGTALVPHAHLEESRELMLGGPVVLFGAVCALNSLGIRLWENEQKDFEQRLLIALYPWMLMVVAVGAGMEWVTAEKWSRLVFGAGGFSAMLLLVLHLWRGHVSPGLRPLLADGALMLGAGLMLGLRNLMD